ncbi:ATP-binding protein [Bacteroidota bacterium]
MDPVYKKLAVHLDKTPNGFPETKSGVELKLLRKLFNPEEAELACLMNIEHESLKTIALKAGKEERPVFVMLKNMLIKGLVDLKKEPGNILFALLPFVVGFYERQNAQIDKEFAELFEQYYQESFHTVMHTKPFMHRVIPVEKSIPTNIDVMPYEKISNYINEAKSWGVLNCICRVQKRHIGEGCEHSLENCVTFSTRPGLFDRAKNIRAIDKEEAIKILEAANKEGLVHTVNNAQEDVSYICNCCSCSCGFLRGMAEFGVKNSVARSDFFVQIDAELCNSCENCIDRCYFGALAIADESCEVDLDRCFGCGLCISECATDAMTLIQKEKDEIEVPSKTKEDWRIARNIKRLDSYSNN